MASPASALTPRVQAAMAAALGPEWAGEDPVIRPFKPIAKKGRKTDAPPVADADLQVNIAMAAAKRLGRPPREVAQAIVEHLDTGGIVREVQVAGPGFVNLVLDDAWLGQQASGLLADPLLGIERPQRQRVVVDYSSPNAAKEMHVAHLRTTVVGDSLARTLERLGHDVVRQNHLGDWGTAFGMLIEHLLEVGEGSAEAGLLTSDPNAFYRAARAKFDADDSGDAGTGFATRARARVALLQGGDAESLRHWATIMDLTKGYLNRVYRQLDITLTDADIAGESSYNDQLAQVCDELEAKGIATVSDGALCVFLDGFTGRDDKPVPLIVRKSDGGYGYATTDIATIRHRSLELHADRALYVVGAPQSLHFRMCWTAADKAGWIRGTEPVHVQIGNVVGPDGKILRTRSGDLVSLQSLVDAALERASAVVARSRPELDEQTRATIAHQIGVAAIKYADLSVAHDSGYTFDLDRMVTFQGATGPYLQYAAARIRSILRRVGEDDTAAAASQAGPITVTEPAERALVLRLLGYGAVVAEVGESLEPHRLAAHLFELAQDFTGFYEHCPVLKAQDEQVRRSRLALCRLTLDVLVDGLGLLGITAPEEM